MPLTACSFLNLSSRNLHCDDCRLGSCSSLDLDHEAEILQESNVVGGSGGARREYGSHGSLDVMGRGGREEQSALGLFPTSEGPAAVSTLTR